MITSVFKIMTGAAPTGSIAAAGSRRAAAGETKWSNGKRTVRNKYPEQPTGTLSHAQKARLSLLSKQAFERVHGRAPESAAEADDFRHAQVTAAIGKPGLRACLQGDYLRVEAWLLDLCGEAGLAMNAHIKHETNPKRVAMAKLKAECAARGLQLGYAAAICRSKYKCALDDASAPQLWKLVFDIRNRKAKSAPAAKGVHPDNIPF